MPDLDPSLSGGCACGSVRFWVASRSDDVAHCCCRMCQRWVGALVVTWATFAPSDVRLEGTSLRWAASSPGVERAYCDGCGSSVAMRDAGGGWLDVSVAAFDDPAGHVPTYLIWDAARPAWLVIAPDLPHYRDGGPDGVRA